MDRQLRPQLESTACSARPGSLKQTAFMSGHAQLLREPLACSDPCSDPLHDLLINLGARSAGA